MAYPAAHPHLDVENAIIEKPDEGVYRANRSIFTDEEIFELEMKYILATGSSSPTTASCPSPATTSRPISDGHRC